MGNKTGKKIGLSTPKYSSTCKCIDSRIIYFIFALILPLLSYAQIRESFNPNNIADVAFKVLIEDDTSVELINRAFPTLSINSKGEHRVYVPYILYRALRDSLPDLDYTILNPKTNQPYSLPVSFGEKSSVVPDEISPIQSQEIYPEIVSTTIVANTVQGNNETWHDGDWDEGSYPSDYSGPGSISYNSWGALGLDIWNTWGDAYWTSNSMTREATSATINFRLMSNEIGTGQYVEIYLREFPSWSWRLIKTITNKTNHVDNVYFSGSDINELIDTDGRCDLIAGSNDGYVFDYIEFTYVCPTPSTPGLYTPSNGATCVSYSQTYFDWSTVSGAAEYEIYISPGGTYTASSSSYNKTLNPGTSYTWKVRAKNSCGVWGNWSTTYSFTTSPTTPSTPSLSTPSNGGTCLSYNPTAFDWSDVSGADGYEIYISPGGTYSASSSNYDRTLSPGTQYTWKVRAQNDCGNWGSWSSTWSFTTIDNPPTAPSLSSPSNSAIDVEPAPVYFDWGNVGGAVQYEIYISNIGSDYTNSSSYEINLEPGSSYSWKVRAKDNCDQWGSWSSLWTFTTRSIGSISGTITTNTTPPAGVGGVRVTADPGGYYNETGPNGSYLIEDINFGTSTTYTVSPSKADHTFSPESQQVTLNTSQPSANSINFLDISSFSVQVTIYYDDFTCPTEGVELYIDDDETPAGITDSDGTATLAVGIGSHTIEPQLTGHFFDPPAYTDDFQSNQSISFSDTTHYELSGFILGSCDLPLGSGTVTVTTPSGCMLPQSVTIQSDGSYAFYLPPMQYTVSPNVPGQTITPISVDLSDGDSTHVDFIKRGPLVIEIAGLPDPNPCNISILNQGQVYELQITVNEKNGESLCPVEVGHIIIKDYIGDDVSPTEIQLESGIASYTLVAGEPNILGGGDHGYQKQFEFTVVSGDSMKVTTLWVIVAGHKPREQTFITKTPELPLLILRDPPGDASYSYISSTESVEITTAFSYEDVSGVGISANIGFDLGGIGLGAYTEANLNIESKHLNQYELGIEYSTTTTYSTSGEETYISEAGDLFAGAALNVIYAITDELIVDESCQVLIKPNIAWQPNGFETCYLYSEKHIRETLIPNLIFLGELESVDLWQEILDMNQELKDSSDFIENRTISAGTSEHYSSTVTSIKRYTLGFTLTIDSDVAMTVGAKVFGVGGEMGVNINAALTYGASRDSTVVHSSTTGYFLSDNDPGDYYSTDLLGDPVFGTPVFRIVSGTSSCPWEPGTQPRDGVSLSVTPTVQYSLNPTAAAFYDLLLGNTSQSDEIRTYCLSILQETNPNGAVIKVNAQTIETCMPFTIDPQTQIPATLSLERQTDSRIYQYEDVQVRMYAECDPGQIADTIGVSAYYASPCVTPHISFPGDNWLINESNSNTIDVHVGGYSLVGVELEQIVLQYLPLGEYNWIDAQTISRESITDTSLTIPWIVTYLADGIYDLRVLAYCQSATAFSNVVSGLIDRSGPIPFGSPQPADGVLGPDEEIQIAFNEDLSCESVTTECVDLRYADTEAPINSQVTCYDNLVIITPLVEDYYLENRHLIAEISCLEDLYGNSLSEPITWSFYVDRSTIYWVPTNLADIVAPDDSITLSAKLLNRGDLTIPFDLVEYQEWLNPTPISGIVSSPTGTDISIGVAKGLAVGTYHDTLYARTSFGDEPLYITITARPNTPPILGVVPNTTMYEDDSIHVMLPASDADGDSLICSAISDTTAVVVTVSGMTLIIQPIENWSGDALITFTVTDRKDSVTGWFSLTVLQVNDPPMAFNLQSPINNTFVTIDSTNIGDSLVFSWDKSNDIEGDRVTYVFSHTGDLSFLDFGSVDTNRVKRSYLEIANLMGYFGFTQASGSWSIVATDGQDSTTASGGYRGLILDSRSYLAVQVDGPLPREYAIYQNYPNPFNPSSTIRFDLPASTLISLVLYDLAGNEVLRCIEGGMEPGSHSFLWDGRSSTGHEVPSGIYIARLVTPAYTKSIKMVLLK